MWISRPTGRHRGAPFIARSRHRGGDEGSVTIPFAAGAVLIGGGVFVAGVGAYQIYRSFD